jgi:hypothetical protein
MRCAACGGETSAGRCPECGITAPAGSPTAAPTVPDPAGGDDSLLVTRFADIPSEREAPIVPPGPVTPPAVRRGRGVPPYTGWALAGTFALALVAVLIVLWPSGPREGTATTGAASATPPSTAAPVPSSSGPAGPVPAVGREKFFVDTFATAAGYAQPGTSGGAVGELRRGAHYVFCKRWGERVSREGGAVYNHWWLLTDLDVVYADGAGARAWVPAVYLTHWGNDEARDNAGRELPDCPR